MFAGVEILDMSLKEQQHDVSRGAAQVGEVRAREAMLVTEVDGVLRNVIEGLIVKPRGLGFCAVLVCD